MTYTPMIDVTASLAPAYFGMLALFLICALGIVFNAWKPRWKGWKGISFSNGLEMRSRSLPNWSK